MTAALFSRSSFQTGFAIEFLDRFRDRVSRQGHRQVEDSTAFAIFLIKGNAREGLRGFVDLRSTHKLAIPSVPPLG